jgi:ubiquinone/menaquinone biosynthesis C-methylase UbiE
MARYRFSESNTAPSGSQDSEALPYVGFAILRAPMGLYRHHIFPRLMDWVMAGEEFRHLRTGLLAQVHGEVLELGIGTGLNLPHYPKAVTRLHAVDPADLLPKIVTERSAGQPFPVRIQHVTAESLPYGDRSFDFVISTWTLCTIPDPVKALQEVHRVLKPDGVFLFLEHGRSEDERVAAWQDRLNPVQNIIGCGCNLNRKIDQLIARAGLKIMTLDRFQMQRVPRLGGEMYQGTATRSD